MKYEAVEVVTLGESREVLACLGRMVVVELDDNGTLFWSVRCSNMDMRQFTIVVSSATSVAMLYVNARMRGSN